MENPLAQKTFTVKKIINGKTLNFTLQIDKALTQKYIRDKKAYAPDFTKTPLIISPLLLVSGLSGNQIANVSGFKWTLTKETGATATQALTDVFGTANKKLSVNLTDCNSLNIKCEATYTDPVSGITSPIVASVSILKIEDSGASISAIAYTPLGDTFVNNNESLKIHCDLWRGGDIDATGVSYTWQQLRGGTWTTLTSANANGISGFNTNEITVPAGAVTNVGIFKCQIKDTDSGSGTYNKTASTIITLYDGTDPYKIDVFQPQSDSVAEGGSIKHKFMIRQGGTYIKDLAFLQAHSVKVWRYAANMEKDTTWGTSGDKTAVLNQTAFAYELAIDYSDLLSATQAFNAEFN